MPNYRQFETCQRKELLTLMDKMNRLHAEMGGRDGRPERIALAKCMKILRQELNRSGYAGQPAAAEEVPFSK